MSGVFKAIGKVFSAVVGVIKKIWKPVLIAAAVYFTAGLALSAMPATSAFAASMPGFAGGGFLGLGVGAGSVAGTGVFTHLAASLGMATLGSGGGLVGGALASGTTAAELGAAGISGSAIAGGATAAVNSGAISAAALPAEGAGAATVGAGGAVSAVAPAVGTAAATAGKMTLAEKFLLASTASNVLGGLTAPSPRDIAEAQKTWVGAFYGVGPGGGGAAPAGPVSGLDKNTQPLIPLSSDASPAPASGMTPAAPAPLPGTTIAPKNKIPDRTQQARANMAVQSAGVQQTVSQPLAYGKQSLIPTTNAPFETTSPGSIGQLDALA